MPLQSEVSQNERLLPVPYQRDCPNTKEMSQKTDYRLQER